MKKEIFMKSVPILGLKIFAIAVLVWLAMLRLQVDPKFAAWIAATVAIGVYRNEFVELVLDPFAKDILGMELPTPSWISKPNLTAVFASLAAGLNLLFA
jgi:hypothetical protein